MRLIVQYTKDDTIKYISHLDLVRTIQRALRRGNIPITYTQGFNPHPKLAFAAPLSVGITSQGEYMDVSLEEPMNPHDFCCKMNKVLPKGIEFLKAVETEHNTPSLMSLVERAEYDIHIFKPNPEIERHLENFINQREIIAEKHGKKGSKLLDIKEMIHRFQVKEVNSQEAIINVILSAGSEKSLNPELLLNTIFAFMGIENWESIQYKIHRRNLFIHQNGQWVTPLALGKGEARVEQADHC